MKRLKTSLIVVCLAIVIFPLFPPTIQAQSFTSEQQIVLDSLRQQLINLLIQQITILQAQIAELMTQQNIGKEQVKKMPSFIPEVTLDKTVIKNNGSDYIQFKIKVLNGDGKIVSNRQIEISTSINSSGGGSRELKVNNVTLDSNGEATYNTPTTTAYDMCGVSMLITIKIDGTSIFGESIRIENTQFVPTSSYGSRSLACA